MAIAIGNPIIDVGYILAGLVFLIGVIMYARLATNSHTPSQVYIGTVLGLLTCFFSVYFALY
jgi:membrane-associated phospholipid phosphatase